MLLAALLPTLIAIKAAPAPTASAPTASLSPRPGVAAIRRFEQNAGQWPADVRFLARTPRGTLVLGAADARLRLRSADGRTTAVGLTWDSTARAVDGVDRLPGVSNYLLGSDRAQWRAGIAGFTRVRYAEVAPHVDLEFYGATDGFEYDVVVQPGGDPAAVSLRFDGVSKTRVDRDGSIVLETSAGTFRQHAPIAFQERAGVRTPVNVRYALHQGRVGFVAERYDRSRPLVIDPTIDFSTFLGGSLTDDAVGVKTDAAGNVYVTGDTTSTDFPTAAALLSGNQGQDAFVAKFTPDGQTLLYATYLGGFNGDVPTGLAVTADGSAYVAGFTHSIDFPLAAAFQSTNSGTGGFLTRLSPDGASLVFSTYLGGINDDSINAVAVDASGAAYVTGATKSSDFPLKNAFKTFGSTFVAKFTPAGSLVYSTLFHNPEPPVSGLAPGTLTAIAVDASGAVYVGGYTRGPGIPATAGAFQTFPASGDCTDTLGRVYFPGRPIPCLDGVVAKLTPSGALAYATYLHPASESSAVPDQNDLVTAITVDGLGNAYVTGWTENVAFPTTPGAAAQGCTATGCVPSRAFVAELNPAGSALVFSATLGGTLSDVTRTAGIALDATGQVVVAGYTGSTDLPLVNPHQSQLASPSLFRMSNNGLDLAPLISLPGLDAEMLVSGSDGTLYLRSRGTNPSAAPLSKSTDGGATWTTVADSIPGFGLSFQALTALTVDPNNSSILYTTSQKSTDGGASWTPFPAKGTAPIVRPGASNVLFALRGATDPAGAIMKSVDGGATWSSSSAGITQPSVDGLTIAPSNANVMYAWVSFPRIFPSAPAILYVSADGGSSWTPRSLPTPFVSTFVVNPSEPLTLYTVANGVIRSTDGGMTWTDPVTFGTFLTPSVYSLVATTATTLFGATLDGIYRSEDRGSTWTRVQGLVNGPHLVVSPGAVFAVTTPAADVFIAALSSTGAVVYESYLGGMNGDRAQGLATTPDGAVVVAGFTSSPNFPAARAFQPSNAGSGDAFVTKLRLPQIVFKVEGPADQATVFQRFTLSGWAVDRGSATDAGIDGIHVWAFGSSGAPMFLGAATPAIARPDIAAMMGAPQFLTSGFSLTVNGLAPGSYVIAVYPHSAITNTFAPPSVLHVRVVSGGLISIGVPAAGSTTYGGANLGGWAIDRAAQSGPGVSTVHVYAYPLTGGGPIFLGVVDYGVSRPDVGAIFGSQFTNSGFNLRLPPLAPGPYLLVAFPFSTASNAFLPPATVTVTFGPSRPNGWLDLPASSATVTGAFEVGGWAIDRSAPSGTGVDAVHVYAFPATGGAPTFLGVATLGVVRSDVGGIFGAQFTPSGYGLNAPALPPGTYDVNAYSRSTVSGTFNFVRTTRITVQ